MSFRTHLQNTLLLWNTTLYSPSAYLEGHSLDGNNTFWYLRPIQHCFITCLGLPKVFYALTVQFIDCSPLLITIRLGSNDVQVLRTMGKAHLRKKVNIQGMALSGTLFVLHADLEDQEAIYYGNVSKKGKRFKFIWSNSRLAQFPTSLVYLSSLKDFYVYVAHTLIGLPLPTLFLNCNDNFLEQFWRGRTSINFLFLLLHCNNLSIV